MTRMKCALGVLVVSFGCCAARAQLSVIGTSPAPNSLGAPLRGSIVIDFDRPVDRSTVTARNLWAAGRWSGPIAATVTYSNADARITLTPTGTCSAGEQVMVVLSRNLRGADGSAIRSAGYTWQFWTQARPASRVFTEVMTLTTRTTPVNPSRAYGGIPADLDADGWIDMTIMNEDTADLRIFMNQAAGTGTFDAFMTPTVAVGQQASPAEPADFNHDGNIDICVANIAANSVSIVLGNGDGTFAPQQQIPVGSSPRGIAVLDVDGDGDLDIVNTNTSSGNLSLLLNNGNGVFGAPTFFDGGGSGEWGLFAADMNNDKIMDLVVGSQGSQTISVLRGNGNGTFTQISSRASGGRVWMLACGDVNGDGAIDVVSANSGSNNGSLLLGNGTGSLGPATIRAVDPFPIANDLADLDGDGDLDWILASFSGDFTILRNDAGVMNFDQELDAPQAGSCTLPFDIDNDGDLDLALIDELADIARVMKNNGRRPPGDLNGDCAVNEADLGLMLAAWQIGAGGDVDDDGDTDESDLGALLSDWGANCAP